MGTRLRTPSKVGPRARVPLAKRALMENKAAKNGPLSVKSAPSSDLDTTFKGLSTTVLATNPSGPVKSMPEFSSTPYCEFAAEINSNAKENRGVRSSAIGDYPKV